MSQNFLNFELENGYPVNRLPNYKNEFKHNGKNTRINNRLASGLYLAQNALGSSRVVTSKEVSFQEKEGLYIGRQDSRHSVMFGLLNSSFNSGDFQIPVAIKPSDKPAQLLGELAILQYLQSETDQSTYLPIGYFSSDSSDYLITEFNNGVSTFDVYEWKRLNNGNKVKLLEEISSGIGRLHSQFLYHGDAHAKNLAIDDNNKFYIVDPEFMVSSSDIAKNLASQKDFGRGTSDYIGIRRQMNRDLTDMYSSMLHKVFNSRKIRNQHDKLNLLNKHVFLPYKSELVEYSNSRYSYLLESLADDLLLDWQTKANNEIL
jgi:serine/threonine protein kinase